MLFGDFKKYISSGSTMMQSHTSVCIIAIVFKYTFLFFLLNEVWRLYGYLFSSYSIFIKSIMIIVIIKRFSSAKINIFLVSRILQNFSIEIQIWNIEYIFQSSRNLFRFSRPTIFWLRRLSLLLNIYNVYKVLLLGFIGTTK